MMPGPFTVCENEVLPSMPASACAVLTTSLNAVASKARVWTRLDAGTASALRMPITLRVTSSSMSVKPPVGRRSVLGGSGLLHVIDASCRGCGARALDEPQAVGALDALVARLVDRQ